MEKYYQNNVAEAALQILPKSGNVMETYYYANTSEAILETIPGRTCPLCAVADAVFDSRVTFKHHFDVKHYRHAVRYLINEKEACILPCRQDCYFLKKGHNFNDIRRAHFHCPFCKQLYSRKSSFTRHLMTIRGNCVNFTKTRDICAFKELCRNSDLISEIEKYQAIYNPAVDEYNDENARTAAWQAVATALDETEECCREKWEKLKAAYYKSFGYDKMSQSMIMYQGASDSASGSPSKAPSEMATLKHIIEIVTDEDMNPTNSDVPDQEGEIKSSRQNLDYSSLNSSEVVEEEMGQMGNYGSDRSPPRKKRRAVFNDDEADMSFLRSLLPDLQRMNHRQKNQFKRNVLEQVGNVLYGSTSEEGLNSLGLE